jgi:hypothetical protein
MAALYKDAGPPGTVEREQARDGAAPTPPEIRLAGRPDYRGMLCV